MKPIFKIELGHLPTGGRLTLPRFLVSLYRQQTSERCLIVGRLYQGYVGVLWNTRLFHLTVWIHKPVNS